MSVRARRRRPFFKRPCLVRVSVHRSSLLASNSSNGDSFPMVRQSFEPRGSACETGGDVVDESKCGVKASPSRHELALVLISSKERRQRQLMKCACAVSLKSLLKILAYHSPHVSRETHMSVGRWQCSRNLLWRRSVFWWGDLLDRAQPIHRRSSMPGGGKRWGRCPRAVGHRRFGGVGIKGALPSATFHVKHTAGVRSICAPGIGSGSRWRTYGATLDGRGLDKSLDSLRLRGRGRYSWVWPGKIGLASLIKT